MRRDNVCKDSSYSFGDDARQLRQYAWCHDNAGATAHPVGRLQPNAWGLYDIQRNVWEWARDWYGPYPSGTVTEPTGPPSGSFRVNRGGSWNGSARACQSAYRGIDTPGHRSADLGMRLLREVP